MLMLTVNKIINLSCEDYTFEGCQALISGFDVARGDTRVDNIYQRYMRLVQLDVMKSLIVFTQLLATEVIKADQTFVENKNAGTESNTHIQLRLSLSYFNVLLQRFNLSAYPALSAHYQQQRQANSQNVSVAAMREMNAANLISDVNDKQQIQLAIDVIIERLNWMDNAYYCQLMMKSVTYPQESAFKVAFRNIIDASMFDIEVLELDGNSFSKKIALLKLIINLYKLKYHPEMIKRFYAELSVRFSIGDLITQKLLSEKLAHPVMALIAMRTEMYLCKEATSNRQEYLNLFVTEIELLIQYAHSCDGSMKHAMIQMANEYYLLVVDQLADSDDIKLLKRLKTRLDALPVGHVEKRIYPIIYEYSMGRRTKVNNIELMHRENVCCTQST